MERWAPTPKQCEFLSAAEDEVLYSGAAGGGKSDALVVDAVGLQQRAIANQNSMPCGTVPFKRHRCPESLRDRLLSPRGKRNSVFAQKCTDCGHRRASRARVRHEHRGPPWTS
jgi:hypothetical protein